VGAWDGSSDGACEQPALKRAVVIGSGPNGLVGAIVLAEAGLEVVVREAAPTLGGGVRSADLTLPGFVHDVCSAVHPLALASPAFRELALDVEWVQPEAPLAHPLADGTAVVLGRRVPDGEYGRLVAPLVACWAQLAPVLLGPFPPAPRHVARAAAGLGPAGALRLVRTALGRADRLVQGTRDRALLAGLAAHSMLPLERRPAAGFALVLGALAHVVGWPFPRGGAQRIADALAARLAALGGAIETGRPVDELPRADVVLADVSPRELVRVARGRLPPRYARALHRFRYGPGAFKLDWALDGPIPWRAAQCATAGTVHLGGTAEEIAASERTPWAGRVSERPFVLLAQPTLFDPSRAPEGKHVGWAYCHVPSGSTEDLAARVEAQVERFAPGFRELILARHARTAADLEHENRNDVGGDLNGGAATVGQLLFRPTRSLVPYRTPVGGLYLCSASTPPGGGVHGMGGYSAALVALADLGVRRRGRSRRRRP
jgi:phytoene dehydrogenase-like protein